MDKFYKIHAALTTLRDKIQEPELVYQLNEIIAEIEVLLKEPEPPPSKRKILINRKLADYLVFHVLKHYAEHKGVEYLLKLFEEVFR